MVFCVNAPAPLFELFRRNIGVGPRDLAMLYTCYAAVVIVALPFFGRASDAYGRRALVIGGLGLIACGSLALGMANTLLVLILGRMLQGLGVAAMSAPAASALAELAGRSGQASAASITTMALAIGGATAPLLSGSMAEWLPSFPTSPLLLCTVLAVFGSIAVASMADPLRIRSANSNAGSRQAGSMPGGFGRPFWQACATVVICFGAQTTFFTVSGPLFSQLTTSHVLLTAGYAMCALMTASALGSTIARRLAAETALVWAIPMVASGVTGFFLLAGKVSLISLAPAIASLGLGHGIGYTGAARLINETADEVRRASYTSRFYMAIYIGGGAPVLIMGLLQNWVGMASAANLFSAGTALASAALFASLWRNRR